MQYHGYGTVGTRAAGDGIVHHQQPRSARSKEDTHASMVTSAARFGDIDFRVRTRTVRHVRDGEPNPWEVSWIVWAYTDDGHFYYFVPKPNGWELGKRDPDYPGGQRDLKTDSRPTFPVGPWYDVRVRQVGARMRVWVDGEEIVRFTDHERPYRRGAIGLYNEDAQVQFDDITVDEP